MKEIVYLDIPLVNSLLAQTNKGLITKLVEEEADSSSNTESGGAQTTTSVSFGVNAVAKADTAQSETEIDNYSVVFSKSNKNLIERALDDYSLDVLLDSLERQLVHEAYDIGQFVFIRDQISIYNFESIINGMSLKGVASQLDDYPEYLADRARYDKMKSSEKNSKKGENLKTKLESNGWNNIYSARIMAEYMDTLFPDSTLIKIADTLSICDNEMIRMNHALLNFNNISKRQATILGIVTSKITETVPEDFSEVTKSDGLYRNAISIFGNIVLGSNSIIEQGDFIVRPIAIYFDNQK